MGKVDDDWDEERSVIGDKGDIGHVDLANDMSQFNYNTSNEGPIIISAPFQLENKKPRPVFVGERISDSITIENTTIEAVEIWSIEIYDSKPSDSFTLSVMEPPSESSDEDYISSFVESFSLENRILRAGQTLTIWLSCKPKGKGLHTTAVHFTVGDDTIERVAFLMSEDKISRSLASDKPYYRPRRNKQVAENSFSSGVNNGKVKMVKGSRPSNPSNRGFKKRLPEYPIPQEARKMIESKGIPDAVLDGLTERNYIPFFKTLVVMEELKMEEDMRNYDMKCVSMKLKGSGFLTLEVPGLAEKRPSLVIGDYVFAKLSSEYENDSSSVYQGYIHRVEAEEVYLRFDDDFHSSHYGSNLYDVQFSYNRINMRRLYQALEETDKLNRDILFPSGSNRKRVIDHVPLTPVSLMLNEEQMNAVEYIVACKGGPPYVIYGPPGTGKTITVTESIFQLVTKQENARILVCAPSNSAADNILEKLLTDKTVEFEKNEIFRLNAQTRSLEDIKIEYLEYCLYDEKELVFQCPILDHLRGYRIILSTYASAALLYAEGIKRGHFTHIFLDEAGQASEPETMVPLSHLYGRDTVVVLAGDPMQLGPVIHSKNAELYGLQKSYLQRLCECKFYGDGDPNYVTKLIRNYRCHPEILRLPSELFYNGELLACKDDIKSPLDWMELLPNKDFPVLFMGVQGVDEREGSNPSWFNRIEASEVVDMVIKLTEKGLNKEDIGIITPYRQQVLKIKKALETFVGPDIKVGTVEQFQGQEREVIIISTVRSTIKHNEFDKTHCLGFLSNPRRFNVAITRARSLLILIGNPHIICKDKHWNKLLWYCSDNGSYDGCFLPNKEEIYDEEYPCENYNGYDGSVEENTYRPPGDGGWGDESLQPGHGGDGEWGSEPFQPEHGADGEWGSVPYNADWGQEPLQPSAKENNYRQPEDGGWGEESFKPGHGGDEDWDGEPFQPGHSGENEWGAEPYKQDWGQEPHQPSAEKNNYSTPEDGGWREVSFQPGDGGEGEWGGEPYKDWGEEPIQPVMLSDTSKM